MSIYSTHVRGYLLCVTDYTDRPKEDEDSSRPKIMKTTRVHENGILLWSQLYS